MSFDRSNIQKCGSHGTVEQARQANESRRANRVPDGTIQIPIRYVVVRVNGTSMFVNDAMIQAQHARLNQVYSNQQDKSKIPNTTRYPYASRMSANPDIQFIPTTLTSAEIITVSRIASSSFSDAQAVRDFAALPATAQPIMTVYITDLASSGIGNNTLLGIAADIKSTYCAVHWGTIGSPSLPGAFDEYGQGMTVCHELAHCLGLFHPFSGDSCTSAFSNELAAIHAVDGYPRQKNPNFVTSLPLPDTNIGLDNAGRDLSICVLGDNSKLKPGDTTHNCATNRYSCLTLTQLQTASTVFEPFMSIMDYGDDTVQQGFSNGNVETMRTTATELFGGGAASAGSSSSSSSASSSSLPVWAIVLIAVVGSLFLLALVWWQLRRTGALRRLGWGGSRGSKGIPNKI